PIRSSVLTISCERICFDIALLTDVIATLCIAVIGCGLSTVECGIQKYKTKLCDLLA
ncbi:unnamed protein product, partial [Cylicocyclus nassatus]